MNEHNSVILMSFECARRGEKGVSASCNVQNEVPGPSWTDSGGQDGVFGRANTGQEGPEGGSNLPIPGAKTEGMQNQRTKASKERVQINLRSSPSCSSSRMLVFRSRGV